MDFDVPSYLLGKSKGSGGTSDYSDLSNKPSINDVTLSGNKTSSDLGVQSEIDSTHKLSADLVDDTNTTNKFVTASDKTTWSGKQDALVSGTNIKTINSQSILGSGDIDTEVIQYSTLPTASVSNLGKIVQYTGTTTNDYTNGYFYQCVSDEESTPTYSWENINVQAGGGSVSEGLPTYLVGSPSQTSSVDIPLETLKAGIYKPQYEKMVLYLTKNGQEYHSIRLINDLIVFKDYADAEVGEIFALAPQVEQSGGNGQNRYMKKTNDTYGYSNDYSKVGNMPDYGNNMWANRYGPTAFNGVVTFNYCPNSYYGPTNDTDLANKKYVDDKPTTYAGYDATKTQVLKNINGTLTWVDE